MIDIKDTEQVQGNFLRDLPEWLEDFTENLLDEGVSASRDTPASTSRDSDLEPPRKVVSGNTVYDVSHVPYRPWCRFCVMGKGLERRHLTQLGDRDDDRPRVFADPEDVELRETNARKSWNCQMEAAMPCMVKNHQYREICGEFDTRKSKHACIVEAHVST